MASTLPPPSGPLVEYLEQMRLAINRSINLVGDDNILVTETTHGKELSFVGEREGPFFAKILERADTGDSGKRWKYKWEEVDIGFEALAGTEGDKDADLEIEFNPRKGTYENGETTYLINLAEINNTSGSLDLQGNGTELVAPLGGQDELQPWRIYHKDDIPMYRIVPVWTAHRRDGSVLFWTDISNSDNIRSNSTLAVAEREGSADESDPSDGGLKTEVYSYNTDRLSGTLTQTGDADEGYAISLEAGVRTNYNHTDDAPKLREFYRRLIFKPNGQIRYISAELALEIDDPEACP